MLDYFIVGPQPLLFIFGGIWPGYACQEHFVCNHSFLYLQLHNTCHFVCSAVALGVKGAHFFLPVQQWT